MDSGSGLRAIELPFRLGHSLHFLERQCGPFYACCAIRKHHSVGGVSERWLVVCPQLLLQLDEDGGRIIKIIPLHKLRKIEHDEKRNTTFFKTAPDVQGWLFEVSKHYKSDPATAEELFSIIQRARRRLEWCRYEDLRLENRINGDPNVRFSAKHGMLNPKEFIAKLVRDPSAVSPIVGDTEATGGTTASVPRVPAGDSQRDTYPELFGRHTYTIRLAYPYEELGVMYDEGDEGVAIRDVLLGMPAARAGVVSGTVLSLDGHTITTLPDFQEALRRVRAAGRTEFDIVVDGDPHASLTIPLAAMPQQESVGSWDAYGDGPQLWEGGFGEGEVALAVHAAKALLIGVDYKSSKLPRVRLRGAEERLQRMGVFLRRAGFIQQRIISDGARGLPADKESVIDGLRWVVDGVEPGCTVFVYVTGHGANLPDHRRIRGEAEACFAPEDYERCGFVTNAEFRDGLLERVPRGVRVVILSDLANGGDLCDLPYRLTALVPTGYQIEIVPQNGAAANAPIRRPKDSGSVVSFCALCPPPRDYADANGGAHFAGPVGCATQSFLHAFRKSVADPTLQEVLDGMREWWMANRAKDGAVVQITGNCEFSAGHDKFSAVPGQGAEGSSRDTVSTAVSANVTLSMSPRRHHQQRMSDVDGRDMDVMLSDALGAAGFVEDGRLDRVPSGPLPAYIAPWGRSRDDMLWAPLKWEIRPQDAPPPNVDPRHRQQLIAFYRKHNPRHLHRVTGMLLQYKGQEAHLFRTLEAKYGAPVPDAAILPPPRGALGTHTAPLPGQRAPPIPPPPPHGARPTPTPAHTGQRYGGYTSAVAAREDLL